MGDWWIWVLFAAIIAALVGFLIYSFVRDKKKNRNTTKQILELKIKTSQSSKELSLKISMTIDENEKMIKKVIPGKSKINMQSVNRASKDLLQQIYESKVFKTIYINSSDVDENFAINLKKIIDTKSNLWSKYCAKEIEYFKNFDSELSQEENFDDLKQKTLEIIKNKYIEFGAIEK